VERFLLETQVRAATHNFLADLPKTNSDLFHIELLLKKVRYEHFTKVTGSSSTRKLSALTEPASYSLRKEFKK
jgi:hypothetical protein